MRKIEFRGKSIKTEKWIFGDIWQHNGHVDIVEKNADSTLVFPETVGQYTGLKDKNGKKIYEGDILRLSDKEYEVNFRRNVQVKWSSGGWWYVEVYNNDGMNIDTLFVGYCHDDSEVIGNIYENGELLS